MSTKTKWWLITALLLIIVGGIIFGGVLNMLKWDISKLSTVKLETNGHEINEGYRDILIETKEAAVELVPWNEPKTLVVCEEAKNTKHSVTLEDGALVIKVVDTRKWYDYISLFNFNSPKITVYLPEGGYGDLNIRSRTGDVVIPSDFGFDGIDISLSTGDVTCFAKSGGVKIKTSTGHVSLTDTELGDVMINVDTGRVVLENVTCNRLESDGDTGNITLKNVIASGRFDIELSTGNVKFDRCDAAEISVETDTGSITGTLLSDKIFFAETDTGRVSVPKTVSGGRCELDTDTGNIKIEVVR